MTLPSALLRGRIPYALYREMNVLDGVAENPEHYVQLSVALDTDAQRRADRRARILANNHMLFEDHEAVREVEHFFQRIIAPCRSIEA